jgi:hypothetical protein
VENKKGAETTRLKRAQHDVIAGRFPRSSKYRIAELSTSLAGSLSGGEQVAIFYI